MLTALAICWSALVLANYLPGHPSLSHLEWLGRALFPPAPPWRAPYLGMEIRTALGAALVLGAANAGWWWAGRRLGSWLRAGAGHRGSGVIHLLLGISVAALGWLGAGLAGLWFPVLGWAVFVGSISTLRRQSLAHGRASVRVLLATPGAWWFAVLLAPAAWVTFAGALAPETELDPLRYHLGLADHFVRVHRVVFRERFIFSSFPLNTSMLFGGLKLVGGDAAAKLLNWELLWLLARQAWLLSLRLVTLQTTLTAQGPEDFDRARWSVMTLLAVPLLWVHATMGFAELLLANAVGAALLIRLESKRSIRAAPSGWLAGFALGTKYQAVQGLLPLAMAWFLPRRHRVRTLLMFAAPASVAAGAWAAKNWWFTGNPVHPLLSGVLPDLEDASRALAKSRFAAADIVGGHGIVAWLGAPWTILVRGDRPATYPLGPVVAILLPWLLLAVPRDLPARFAAGFAVVWAFTTAGWNRYLIGALPAFAAGALAVLPTGIGRLGLAAALVVGHMLGALTVYQRQNPMPLASGCEDPATYFAVRAPFLARGLDEADHRLAGSEKYYAYGELVTYGAAHEGLADFENDTPLIQLLVEASRGSAELRKQLRQRGIAAILHNAAGGVTASAVADRHPWTPRDIAVYQEFFRLYAVADWRLEQPARNEFLAWYRLRTSPAPQARLGYATAWPHLPAMEFILGDGDALYTRGDRAGALVRYEAAAAAYPGYVWAHQRVAEVARELGRRDASRRAAAMVRRLGG